MTWLANLRPPRRVSAVEWIEANVRLAQGGAGAGARYRAATLPYVSGILTTASHPDTRRVSIKKSAQSGLTTAVLGWCSYALVTRGWPVLWVAPTTAQVQAFSKGPVADALRNNAALSAMLTTTRKLGTPGSSLLTKVAANGAAWHFAGGNSPNSYAALSVAVTVLDDCDRVPPSVSLEGDPVHLIAMRTTAWPRPVSWFVSTPVLAGGRIESLYAAGDRRRWHCTCPQCKRTSPITFSDHEQWSCVWDDRNPRTARLRHECGYEVREAQRMELVRAGAWQATATPLQPGHVSYEVTSMLSPFVGLEALAEKFIVAHGTGPRALREFVTLHLACGWKDEAASVSGAELLSRLEEF